LCVPIKESGELLGIIYVGNNNVVNLFSHDTLQALEIFAAQAALIIKNALLVRELQRDVEELSISIQSMRFGSLIGSCAGMMEIYKRIERIAAVDVPVLVLGETGTGKELVAREIHQKSNRKNGALVVVNCGAIPENFARKRAFRP
jgi:transcriptional regulator with GAF, ATPase, and Fis domain